MKKFLILIFTIIVLLAPVYFCNAAEITSFSPSSVKVGESFNITGKSFLGISKIFIGNKEVPSGDFTINGVDSITVNKVPVGTIEGKIKIRTILNNITTDVVSADSLMIEGGIYLNTTSGVIGSEITISSNDDISGSEVFFGIVKATTKINTKNLITVDIPTGAQTGKITVKTAHSGDIVSSFDFVVNTGIGIGTTTPAIGSTSPIVPPPATNGFLSKIKPGKIIPVCNTILNTNGGYTDPCDFSKVITLINNLINFIILTLATPLFALIIIYVGWLYLSSGGSSENVSKAKTILKNVVIGYVIILAAWLIVHTILSALGFQGDSFLG